MEKERGRGGEKIEGISESKSHKTSDFKARVIL